MPNIFAHIMLLGWPIVAIILFRTLPLQKALVWSIIAGHLVLPSSFGIKFPVLPQIDRYSVVALSALALCLIHDRSALPALRGARRGGLILIGTLLAIAVFGPVLTVLTNRESYFMGPAFFPGLGVKDAVGLVLSAAFAVIPFWLGLRYLNNREGHVVLLQAFALSAVVYAAPTLFEVRMSPQLHTWIYGFFPHSFAQHVRQGGFRPVVFLSHGLVLGIFFGLAFLSAVVLFKEALRTRKVATGWLFAAILLMFVLVYSKNVGALMIAVSVGAILLLTGRRVQIGFAITVALFVLLYPMLRGTGWVPVDTIYAMIEPFSLERAESLRFRLVNEEQLLDRAAEKPLFGWGSWGRNQLFNLYSGQMTSVTDGVWVIFIGAYGWIGYIGRFGLLTVPVLLFFAFARSPKQALATRGLVVMLSAALIDLIPNSALVNYVWLIAGGVAGFALLDGRSVTTTRPQPVGHPDAPPAVPPFGAGPVAPPAAWLAPEAGPAPGRRKPRRGSLQG